MFAAKPYQQKEFRCCAAALVANLIVCGWLSAQDHAVTAPGRRAIEQAVAYPGEPMGAFRIELALDGQPDNLATPKIHVSNSEDRLFFPVVGLRTQAIEPARRLQRPRRIGRPGGLIDRVRNAIRSDEEQQEVPVAITVSGMFTGDEPLTITLTGEVNTTVQLTITQVNPSELSNLQRQWWGDYVNWARDATVDGQLPTFVHQYLLSTLGRRFSLPAARLVPDDQDDEEDAEAWQPIKTLALLAAVEPLRAEIYQDVLDGSTATEAPLQPVPQGPDWRAEPAPVGLETLAPEQLEVEEIASRIPPECFYLRFGDFQNYVWFQDLSDRYGGDVAQAVTIRGHNFEATQRVERMLAAKMTTLAKMFGGNLVNDIAVIGTDLYVKEGASLGALMFASNPTVLKTAIEADRKRVLAANADATLTSIEVSDRNVSFLTTPDNRIRSFYVADGPYIFVTTSQTLMRRFLEVGHGDRSLAELPAFQMARAGMPVANNYTAFAFFSSEFFENLLSPQYQIELRRRLEAIAHIEIAEVASRAAQAEGLPADSLDAMAAGGFLPLGFNRRADGSQTLLLNNQWIDSARGRRGSFIPIVDLPLTGITEREAAEYAQTIQFYQTEWNAMDPFYVGLRRFPGDEESTELISVEAQIAPFEAGKYGWVARQLAEPTTTVMQLPPGDAANVQMHLRGDTMLGGGKSDYHLFAGIQDTSPPNLNGTDGLLQTLSALRILPGYVGSWPKRDLLERLPIGARIAQPDALGFTQLLAGLWRWEDQQFSILSFDRTILNEAVGSIGVAEASDVAQARAKIADLSGSELANWINDQWYRRGRTASEGNLALLETLQQQLKIPAEECLDVAQDLLDIKLQCPLGGRYEMSGNEAPVRWHSTALNGARIDPAALQNPADLQRPAGYVAPWLEWFRGGELHVTQLPGSLSVAGLVKTQMQEPSINLRPQEEPPQAMDFDVFSFPMKLFGGQTQSSKDSAPKKQSF